MGQEVPNIGILGIDSIRLGGMTLDTLPMAEAAITQQQWSKIQTDCARQEVENIIGAYPKTTIAYLESRVAECHENIKRIHELIADQNTMINEYSTQIGLCAHRDAEVAKLNPDWPADKEQIKALKLQFPPYDVKAMKQQIEQCKEAIIRSETVIDTEYNSISEVRDAISQCCERDRALEPYGVKVA